MRYCDVIITFAGDVYSAQFFAVNRLQLVSIFDSKWRTDVLSITADILIFSFLYFIFFFYGRQMTI